MRTFWCFLFTVFILPFCISQTKQVDSLKHQLALTKQDTTRALILAQLAQLTRNRPSDSTAYYSQEALALAKQIKFPKVEALALRSLGQFFRIKGDLSKALDFQMRAIQVAEKNQLWEEQSIILTSIGTIYLDLRDHKNAIIYLKKALAIQESTGNGEQSINTLLNLSVGYRHSHQLGLALSTLKSIQNKVNASNSLDNKAFFFAEWSNVQFELDNYETGISYMKKAILLSQSSNIQRRVASGYTSLARYFQKLNQRDSAIYYAQQGLSSAQAISFKRDILSSSKLLAELYEPQDFQKALYYQKLAMETNDELFGATKVQELQKIVLEEQERQRKIETERDAYQNRLKQYALLAGLGVMFLIGFILYRNNRQKQKANQVLENTLSELKTAQVQLENRNRDLEMETALERVRTRAMAMQNSEDVGTCVATMFAELGKLGVENIRCGIAVLHPSQTMEVWSFNTSEDGKTRHGTGFHDVNAHPLWKSLFKGWEQKLESMHYYLQGQDRINYFRVVSKNPNYKLSDAVIELPDQHFQAYYFPEGAIWTFSLDPHSDKDKQILKKITSVFSLTFRRYQDLKTAEAQSREARIEVALERVRSRTMAMHQSNELAEVATLLYRQMSQLGGLFDRFSIGIINEPKGIVEIWATDQAGNLQEKVFIARLDEKTTIKKMYDSWKSGQQSLIIDLQGDEFWEWIRFAREEMGISVNEQQLRGRRLSYLSFFSQGYLTIQSNESIDPAIHELLKRFATVFNLTYTRFLDLQKAEAQLREAQIEAALENVRSRSLAMQKSTELRNVVSTVVERMIEIGLNIASANIILFDEYSKDVVFWTKTNKNDIYSNGFSFPYTDDPAVADLFDAFERRAQLFTKKYTFEEKNALWKNFFEQSDFRNVPADRKKFILEATHFSLSLSCRINTAILLTRYIKEPFSETDNEILKRFATVFEQAYTRFLDLQKAEVNEHEAIRQASLDRVRAEIASMRTRNDLQRITPLIWKELTTLTVPFIRCGVFIMDESTQKVNTYLSTPDGRAIASFDLPYASSGITPEVVAHWRNRQIFSDHWDEAQFRAWSQSLLEQGLIQSDESYVSEAPPKHLSLYFLPFRQGMLYVGNGSPLTNDEIQLAQVLADAFSTAYARYRDFNELEETKLQVEKAFAELKSTQAQLIQKEKLASLGELTAGIAHEIQNPLNFVNNFSELSVDLAQELNEEVDKEPMDKEFVKELMADLTQNQEKINHHGKRASSIVKGMLEHSRTGTGERKLTDISQLADEYLRLSYHGLRAKDTHFNCDFELITDKNLPKIEVVPQEIGRVLLNLINNAFYAVHQKTSAGFGTLPTLAQPGISEYKPMVTVSTEKVIASDGVRVLIRVKDNGTGMSEATKAKIFQPFFTTKPTGEGTGLGLSLAYDIVTKGHGGTLDVESAEGKGTEMIISLPI